MNPSDPQISAAHLEPLPAIKKPLAVTRFDEVVTGQFDADESDLALEAPKRVLSPQPETPKLQSAGSGGLGFPP
jgi:23S rRNA pseudouridine2605 synthase